jgi:hypothetical protein
MTVSLLKDSIIIAVYQTSYVSCFSHSVAFRMVVHYCFVSKLLQQVSKGNAVIEIRTGLNTQY